MNPEPRTWCVVRDGRWTGATYTGPESDLEHNVPPGCQAAPGTPADLIAAGAMQPHVHVPTLAEVERQAREERNRRIAATDWTQLPDAPPGTAATWAPYRQLLRDITAQPGWPHNPDWPVPPA